MRFLLGLLAALTLPVAAPAGVAVVSNFTPDALTFTVAEAGGKPRIVTLKKGQIAPVPVNGPAAITYATKAGDQTLRLDPFHAYAFGFDPKTGPALTGIELPGKPPERDARAEPNPPPRAPVKIPVTLLVEDTDRRADALWQTTVRKRFEEAAAVVEAHSGIRFEVDGFATWHADAAPDLTPMLVEFERAVKVKPGHLAVGFVSRKLEDKGKGDDPVGATAGALATHLLVREAKPAGEGNKVEVLVHYLGRVAGAVTSPFEWSVMRPRPGDGKALHVGFDIRFDPLNALAMCVWAEELRNGPVSRVGDASAATRTRLGRVYEALLKAKPGETLALAYLTELENPGVARGPEPKPAGDQQKADNPLAKVDRPPAAGGSPRDEAARQVVRAVVERAKANAAGPNRLTGDDLTAAYVRAAIDAALKLDEADRTSGFLVGLAVALDDTGLLRDDALTANAVKGVETDAERRDRLVVLGNPTVRQRRDLCRRFAAGCGVCGLQSPGAAEGVAVGRAQFDLHRPVGLSFAALAAELAGAEFARQVRDDGFFLARVKDKYTVADFVPSTDGLRDGLSAERFEEDFGGTSDKRFKDVLADIRARLKKMPGYGR
jgi:hypothetical protein